MLENELIVAKQAAREAGRVLIEFYNDKNYEVNEKSKGDFVTTADHAADACISEILKKHFPGDMLLTEESLDTKERLQKKRVWIIDPLDGTRSFVERRGEFGVHIALTIDGEVVLGIVYGPMMDELYYAVKGNGAFREKNGKLEKLSASQRKMLDYRLVASGHVHYDKELTHIFNNFPAQSKETRSGMGLKMCFVAAGEYDIYIRNGSRSKEWDICAGDIILQEAGGMMTGFNGEKYRYNKQKLNAEYGVIATNGIEHAKVLKLVSRLVEEYKSTS